MAVPVISWIVDSDNKLDIVGVKTAAGLYPTDATVVVTVRNRAGTALTGLTNVAAVYVAGTTGVDTIYRMPAALAVVPPIGLYKAKATVTKDSVVLSKHAVITVEQG